MNYNKGVVLLSRIFFGISFLLICLVVWDQYKHEDKDELRPQASKPLSQSLEDSRSPKDHFTLKDKEAMANIQREYATGNYESSLTLAKSYKHDKSLSPAFHRWLLDQWEAIFSALAWLKLNTGRCDQAIELFKQAEKIHLSPNTAKGLASCYREHHHLDAAEDKILWHLKNTTDPDTDILYIYAEVLESKGRYAEAASTLEKLQKLDPELPLKNRITRMKNNARKAHHFQNIQTQYFSLTFESQAHRNIAENVLNFLEKSLDDILVNYRFKEPKRPIEVLLYTEIDFRDFNPDSPLWAEALFNGRIRVPILESHELSRLHSTLKHELVHALFSQMTGARSLPKWFDEGMAQLISNCNNGCVPFQFNVMDGPFLKEKDFLKPFVNYDYKMARQVYAQSLYLVLTLDHKFQSSLQTIIENIDVDTPLKSDLLLEKIEITFPELIRKAEILWNKKINFKDM